MLSGISPAFAGLSQTGRQVVYVLLTRAPLYLHPEGHFRVRLACVRHAASVRSEPGSNSWFDAVCHLYPALRPRPRPGPGFPAPAAQAHTRAALTVAPQTLRDAPTKRASGARSLPIQKWTLADSLVKDPAAAPRSAGPGAAAACSACHPNGAARSTNSRAGLITLSSPLPSVNGENEALPHETAHATTYVRRPNGGGRCSPFMLF